MNNDVRRKFRVYDTLTKNYRNGEQFALLCDGGLLKVSMFNLQILNGRRFVVEQCTGVTDDRMTPIYENDIVGWKNERWRVEFSDGCWNGHAENGKTAMPMRFMYEGLEVIGNIHEGLHE